MFFVRQLIGVVFLLGVLILAWDVLYNIFYGFVPPLLKSSIDPFLGFMAQASAQICYPITIVLNFILSFMPGFVKELFPVTETGILSAKIAWIPFIALIVYTNILKYIDEWFFIKRFNDITPVKKDESDKLQ